MNTLVDAIYQEIAGIAELYEAPRARENEHNGYWLQAPVAAPQYLEQEAAPGAQRYGCQDVEPKEDLMAEFFVQPNGPVFSRAPTPEAPQHMTLHNSDHWQAFHEKTNEMKVLNCGRGLFPRIELKLTDLLHESKYTVGLRMVLRSPHKCTFVRGKWTEERKERMNLEWESKEVFTEQKTGAHAMAHSFDLSRKKIYNKRSECKKGPVSARLNTAKLEDMMLVAPGYCYIPVVSLYRVIEDQLQLVEAVVFPETEFIVVTDYKNGSLKPMKNENKHTRDDVRARFTDSVSPPTLQYGELWHQL